MSELSDTIAAVKKALAEAEKNLLAEYDRVLEAIDADGVIDAAEEQLEAQVTDNLLAFLSLKKAILLAIEQLQAQSADLEVALPNLYSSIKALQEAENDLVRILSVQKRINQALGLVVKLATRLTVPLPL
ncbi:MAG: hypothetical protein ACPG1C_00845 [Alphaproteobacteria bacterium]